jgi:uncharacterized membrane protein
MGKNRLEAFSDGVIAIITTIMVLKLRVPKGESIYALAPLIPVFAVKILETRWMHKGQEFSCPYRKIDKGC